MLSAVNNISIFNTYRQNIKNTQVQPELRPALSEKVSFTGKSLPSMYTSVFDYIAAEILSKNKRVNGSLLSASRIQAAVQNLLEQDKIFTEFKRCVAEKIKWKSYIPQDIRVYSVEKINQAREARLAQWRDFLKYPALVGQNGEIHNEELVMRLKNDKSLGVVIWDAITSEIKDKNRHIPVPFNERALLETIQRFERIDPRDRAISCIKPSFLDIYTHKLRDDLLMEMGLSNNSSIWVKIPSLKHDPANKEENIAHLEILSCKNWCTRSSVDKARAALEDGDFYIYLRRNSGNFWEPMVGMTTLKGKIDQIQGVENNNIVPLNLVGEIKEFIEKSGLKYASGVYDEGPKAYQAIMISEKLDEKSPVFKKTFMKAIMEGDAPAMFEFLGIPTRTLEDGTLQIANYKPSYSFPEKSVISVPYSMFSIDENQLLRNVKIIDGNLILYHDKKSVFNSTITEFPPNLERVKGHIVCSKEQYEKYKDDILRVIGGDLRKLYIRET